MSHCDSGEDDGPFDLSKGVIVRLTPQMSDATGDSEDYSDKETKMKEEIKYKIKAL